MKQLQKEVVSDLSALGALPACAALAILFFLLGEPHLAGLLLIGYLAVFAVALPIRLFYYKDRPERWRHSNLIELLAASSFPSIHAFRAAFIAVLISLYFKTWLFTAIFFFYAIVIITSRVLLKRHYWIDVSAGCVLGILLGAALSAV